MPDTLSALPPLSLYIHIPWCVRKCPYCDFNSHETKQELPEQEYIARLLQDLRNDRHFSQGRPFQSIFIGGGTPSLFQASAFDSLLTGIDSVIPIAPNAEITMEANPGTFEQQKFRDFFATGINRLSIGIQSFRHQQLTRLGRIHNGDEALRAFDMASNAGFRNINLDLMHGLPGQTTEFALQDLRTAIALNPTHLSWYQLTIEPNTVFYSKPPPLPADNTLWDIQEQGLQLLTTHGYEQYEVSAYASPGKRCSHNLNYWQFGDYMAIGAGAHGKITDLENQTLFRYQKTRLPNDYLNPGKPATSSRKIIARDQLAFEFFMNGLRLNDGIPKQWLDTRTGLSVTDVADRILEAKAKGLLLETESNWQPSSRGKQFLNELLTLFL